MSAAKQSDSAEPISLETAKVVHVDRDAPSRTSATSEDTKYEPGFCTPGEVAHPNTNTAVANTQDRRIIPPRINSPKN